MVNQGKPFKKYVQKLMPEGTVYLDLIKDKFSTFDHYMPDRTAVSTKTLDTGAKTYQKLSEITRKLNTYINEMGNFIEDGNRTGFRLRNSIIVKKMQLGIPLEATPEQLSAIAKSMEYANSKGMSIIVTKVK